MIDGFKAKGEEGGREWYWFMRGNEGCQEVSVGELLINGEVVTEEKICTEGLLNFRKISQV